MSFQFHSLHPAQFAFLFFLSMKDLAKARAIRKTVDVKPGYPCRVSLIDANVGETVILVNFQHQSAESPFRAAHAIYVRENAEQAFPPAGTVPELFLGRLISIRAFDENHFMVDAEVLEGRRLQESIPAMMRKSRVAYLHLHNARLGCFLAKVTPN